VKFADLLQFQKPPQNLEDLHEKATAYAALTPRLRTEFLEECEIEAKNFIEDENNKTKNTLHNASNANIDDLNSQKINACTDIFEEQVEGENALEIKKSGGLQRQVGAKNFVLENFEKTAAIPDVLTPIQSANQVESLKCELAPYPQTALPLRFRILSRANENYGANNWTENLENTAENFYDLLTGNAEYTYHSDLEPAQTLFLQGAAGNFICNKMFSAPHGYSNAIGTAPMAAVCAFSFKNITEVEQMKSISFALSSYNFAGVFLKTETWTPLFQATGNGIHDEIMTADFIVPANQTATILLVSTPYYYRFGTLRAGNLQSHIVQFLQMNVFNVREMLGNELVARDL
jgi:hypothetical protein